MGMHYSQYKRASEELRFSSFFVSNWTANPVFHVSSKKKKVKALEILKRKGKKSLKVKTDRYAQIDQKKRVT